MSIHEQIERAKERAERGDHPVNDLAYCKCGTVWTPQAFRDQNYAEADLCPDCYSEPIHIEKKRRAKR